MKFSHTIPNYFFEEKKSKVEKTAQKIFISKDAPFNTPNAHGDGGDWAIWYGPGGAENAENATEVERDGEDFRVFVYDYIDSGENAETFLKREAYVTSEEILKYYSATSQDLMGLTGLCWAARAGTDFISNGLTDVSNEDYVLELPQ